MTKRLTSLLASLPFLALAGPTDPIAQPDLVFEEKDGLVTFEAEHFFQQDLTGKRAWYLTTKDSTPDIQPDGDPSFIAGASGGAYLEILPDTRRTHGDKLINGENFINEPGKMALLSYKVHFNTPGTYWIWARALSTTSEDNGMHFGIDGAWPETAQRWQTVVKNRWHWESKQRTAKVHTGVRGILTLDVDKPGEHTIHISMREDGIELDKIILVNRKDYQPEGLGPAPAVKAGTLPKPFPFVKAAAAPEAKAPAAPAAADPMSLEAASFDLTGTGYYLDKGKWLAINPDKNKTAKVTTASPFPEGKYHITLKALGESDGSSTYRVTVNDAGIGTHTCPMSTETYEEGPRFHKTFRSIAVATGDVITISSAIASADGQEFSRARWSGLAFQPADDATRTAVAGYIASHKPAAGPARSPAPKRAAGPPLQQPRKPDGNGEVMVSGELKQWHKVTLNLDGPYAHELDNAPNPFRDRAFNVTFAHESGQPVHVVPGYFAADGRAADSSAESGTAWKAHLSPDKPGTWTYTISFTTGKDAALDGGGQALAPYDGQTGTFTVAPTDKSGRDFRAQGRLSYVGKHHLQFQGSKKFFLKAGADAPETLLGYADFDGTVAGKPARVPLKTYAPHVADWKAGDPTWKNGKGKGLIGALNYLASTGANAFSFLPYNAGGDGDNVWPFTAREDKFHYDCSKLDQWGIVFDHATTKGLYLHFKMQETEMDDNRGGHQNQSKAGNVPTSLDGGRLGPERKLYCRELIARFGHALALNWNIGEENTQSTGEIKDMIGYIHKLDPYDHHVVLHTFPNQQDKQYGPLLGYEGLTGLSVQNSNVKDCHNQVVKWVRESSKTKHPWVVAFDEPGDATYGMPPDDDYPGMAELRKGKDAKKIPTVDDIRKYTLWGTIMAGGGGVEYYFGYKLPQNDLVCEDWRSRDQSWNYCRIALEFFAKVPFQDMTCRNELIGNTTHDNSKYCLARDGELYLVYLPTGGSTGIELPAGSYQLGWLNPRTGDLVPPKALQGHTITAPDQEDWLAIISR